MAILRVCRVRWAAWYPNTPDRIRQGNSRTSAVDEFNAVASALTEDGVFPPGTETPRIGTTPSQKRANEKNSPFHNEDIITAFWTSFIRSSWACLSTVSELVVAWLSNVHCVISNRSNRETCVDNPGWKCVHNPCYECLVDAST